MKGTPPRSPSQKKRSRKRVPDDRTGWGHEPLSAYIDHPMRATPASRVSIHRSESRRSMVRSRAGGVLALVSALASSREVGAANVQGAELIVQRGAGTGDCPDEQALAGELSGRIRLDAPSGEPQPPDRDRPPDGEQAAASADRARREMRLELP